MNIKLNSISLWVVLCISFGACTATGQRVFINGEANVDSLFENFECPYAPEIPDSVIGSSLGFSLHVIAYVLIDTSGKVHKITLRPLHGIGNDISATSELWELLQASIMKASQSWVFKPIYYDTTGLPHESLKWINQSAAWRPNGGRQSQIILLSFYPYEDTPIYDRLYGVDIFGVDRTSGSSRR